MLWRKVIFINSLPLAGFVLGCKEHEKVWTHKCDVTKHRVWVCWGSGTVWRHQGHEEEPKLWKTCSHQNDCGNYACIPFICLMTCNIFFCLLRYNLGQNSWDTSGFHAKSDIGAEFTIPLPLSMCMCFNFLLFCFHLSNVLFRMTASWLNIEEAEGKYFRPFK